MPKQTNPTNKRVHRTPRTLTEAETVTLLNYLKYPGLPQFAKHCGIRNYVMTLIMLDAGLRVGELTKLRQDDLWFRDAPIKAIVVNQEIAKNHIERTIPVSSRLWSALILMHMHLWKLQLAHPPRYAFYNSNCNFSISVRQVQRIINTAALDCLGKMVTPHVLRHTFASRLMRTTNARIVQELLGHKSLTSTQVYTHPNLDDLRKAIGSLEKPEVGEKEKPLEDA